jgi:hypothetical protein
MLHRAVKSRPRPTPLRGRRPAEALRSLISWMWSV